ncbi:hypothetical protein ACHAXA_010950 [Cyclostephanos tholiformis]|uniref:Uncharacterized protein n=1 Tax=Cyclostephanos tholiformis TaxID=382380 RepID=A0ABD3R7N3_9STRA
MNETTILLSGDPKAKPDFLATLEPTIPRHPSFILPFELVIDEYTREPWSLGKNNEPSENDDGWISCYLVSTDGRNRLAGFLKYLQERKKAAVARFEASDAHSAPVGRRAVLVVPYDPPPIPTEDLPEGVDGSRVVFVKYLSDENILKRRRDRPPDPAKVQPHQSDSRARAGQQKSTPSAERPRPSLQNQNQTRHGRESQQQPTMREKNPIPIRPASSSGKGGSGGLLGNLLVAKRRTENHLDVVRAKKGTNELSFDPSTGAAGCINAFRAKVSSDLEAFKADPSSFMTKIPIALASLVRSVPPDERDRVTMDVFRFAVYEQVEEIGMDRWVAAREPSEFMDECVIAVYKEGHCPEEVLEDLNKGELPDEIRGQARHIVESLSKAVQRKEKKMDEIMAKNSIVDDVVVLNTNKRDRRTLEQIQKDLLEEDDDVKRNRFG